MTIISINFYPVTNTASAPWTYNAFSSSQVGVGTLSSDLKDNSNVGTGYSLSVINAFTGAGGSAATATSSDGTFPEEVLDYYWYNGATSGKLRLGNLIDGSSYSIKCIGHTGSNGTRDTDFTIGGTTTRYDNSGTATPNAAITITGTVSGTTLDIDTSLVVTFAYVNGLEITITPPASRSINNIDGDNNVQPGQTNVTVNTVGMDASPTVKTATLGGESLTVVSAGETSWTVNIPLHINLEWGSTTNDLVLTDDTGSVTLNNVTLSTPTGWETVTLTSLPDTATTESFYELSITDSTVGNFTAAINDILAFESQTGLTIDNLSVPEVDPPLTVSGAYKWWDVSLSTWTPVSSFTINDLGAFGESSQIILRDVLRDVLKPILRGVLND